MAEAKDLGKERNPEAYYSRMKTFVQGATEEGRPFFLMVNSADPHRRFYGNDPDEWYDDLDPPAAVPSRTFSADEVATYTTTDPEDQTVIWQLTGEDQGRFVFSNGLLRFVTTPDFESPADAGGNNEYSVTVRASDGPNPVTHAVTVTVTNEEEPGTLSLSSEQPQVDAVLTATLDRPGSRAQRGVVLAALAEQEHLERDQRRDGEQLHPRCRRPEPLPAGDGRLHRRRGRRQEPAGGLGPPDAGGPAGEQSPAVPRRQDDAFRRRELGCGSRGRPTGHRHRQRHVDLHAHRR